jgi:protein-tyrosine phosphatase
MRILFVCLGNICRSPMAEGIFGVIAANHHLQVEVDSAGTAAYHVGEHPDARAIRCCANHGVSIGHLKARQFKAHDFHEFDHIFVMDKSNLENVLKHAPNPLLKQKVRLYLEAGSSESSEVPDPWYGDMRDFEQVYAMLWKAGELIVKSL